MKNRYFYYSYDNLMKMFIYYSENLEKIYNDYSINNNYLKDSINYYIGLIEISIFCLRNSNHIKKKELYYKEFYIASYLKKIFFNYSTDFNISSFFRKNQFNCDYYFVVVLLIYPDYYIDAVYKSINYNDNNSITSIITKRGEYVNYIKYVVNEILKIKEYHNNDILCNITKLF